MNDYEKARVYLKMEWEGGLYNYCDYGLSRMLYKQFSEDFDKIFKLNEKKQKKLLDILEENIIIPYLLTDSVQKIINDENIDLNDYNYALE